MLAGELDFQLPPELIAQAPADRRADSRLLHYRRADQSITHRRFADIPSLLRPGDLLVLNDTRVLPARLELRKPTGGRIEGLFLAELAPGRWRVMLRNLGRRDQPLTFSADPDLIARPVAFHPDGHYDLELNTTQPAADILARVGRMPLPPYIKRDKVIDHRDDADRNRYQTVYARAGDSVAAPTAGLHFTPELFTELNNRDVQTAYLTLTVGVGTFKPVTADHLDQHDMHAEAYSISPQTASALNQAKQDRRRIIAVGSTSARVLESQPTDTPFAPVESQTSIFIRPPYQWKHVDALVTNFHLPRSTLIALVAAFTGLDQQRRIYQSAIAARYRFFSYGDAMWVE